MDPGAIIALAGLVVTVLIAVFGGVIRHLISKVERLESESKADREKFETKLDLADRTVDAKQDTINELRRQLDKLEITAEIQHRFLDQLPKQLPPSPSGER